MRSNCLVSCFVFLCWIGIATAQETHSPQKEEAPLITANQIQTAIPQAPSNGLKDVDLRVVPIHDQYNVGISIVRRSLVNGKPLPDALEHHAITEIYQVISGCGTLVTGGTLAGAKEIGREHSAVIAQIGPSAQGVAIEGGEARKIAPGDMVVIPTDVPHGFSALCPEGIMYVLVRVDAKRVLQPK